ncbi:hypothetical protein F4804DRAFT_82626 [Jackrogersella minutella]|nr:hypothetical protein F4804DRAFT_82626 [Jackrogersella minutella]
MTVIITALVPIETGVVIIPLHLGDDEVRMILTPTTASYMKREDHGAVLDLADPHRHEEENITEVETARLFESDPSLIFQEVEDEGLSKSFMIPKAQQNKGPPLNILAKTAHPEWNQPEAKLEDGSNSRLFEIHASEYSLNKDGRKKIRLMCPDRPPPDSKPPAVQFRWLHLQKQSLRLDDLIRLVINSPYISGELKIVTLNVLEDIKNRASRRLVGGPHVEPGSILRGVGSYDVDEDIQNQPVIFLSSPYLLLNRKPPLAGADKEHRMLSLLESLYGYDVESDRQDSDVMQRMSLGPSKDRLYVPQLWCLLVGNDILITLSELPVPDLAKDLIDIDRKTSSLRRPLTIQVLDQYRRPHTVVTDADCNYVDFLRHAFALAKEEAGEYVTNYELLDENRELVTPQRWLMLIQQGKLQDTQFYIVPRFQLYQLRESRSRSRSQPRNSRPREMSSNDPVRIHVGGRRPYASTGVGSRTSLRESTRNSVSSNRGRIAGNRMISPEPRPDYNPDNWALVRYQRRPSADNLDNSGEAARENGTTRKLVTWKDQVEEQHEGNEEKEGEWYVSKAKESVNINDDSLRLNRTRSNSQNDPNLVENMQIVLGRPAKSTTGISSMARGTPVYRRRGIVPPRRSQSQPRSSGFLRDMSPLRRHVANESSLSMPAQYTRGRVRRGSDAYLEFRSRQQRSRSNLRGPDIIVNDAAYATAKPKLLTLGALSDDEQTRRPSSISSNSESDSNESDVSVEYYGRRRLSFVQRQYSTGSDQAWKRENSPGEHSETSDTDSDSSGTDTTIESIKQQYPKRGKTTVPANLVSIKAVIDLGYPFSREGDMIVLQRALNEPLIDELLELSKIYKAGETKTAEPTVRFERSRTPSNKSRSRSGSSASRTPEPDISPAISPLPFFHWKVGTENDGDGSNNADVILVQMLAKSDRQLDSDKTYNKIYACTLDDLFHRHADLIGRTRSPAEASTRAPGPSLDNTERSDRYEPTEKVPRDANSKDEEGFTGTGKAPEDGTPNTQVKKPPQNTGLDSAASINAHRNISDPSAIGGQLPTHSPVILGMEDAETTGGRGEPPVNQESYTQGGGQSREKMNSIQVVGAEEIAMKSLLDLSQELLGTFLPKEGSASFSRVCKRFWGSLDEIFRQIIWSLVNGPDQRQWVIHNFTPNSTLSKALPRAPTNKKTFSDCKDCNGGKMYASHIEAIDHLHSEHMSCLNHGKNKQPYDDPCFVWLRRSDDSQTNESHNEIITNTVNQFIKSLKNVKDLAMELHYLVATTSGLGSDSEDRPFLPSNVFYAFQEILFMYLLTSKQLSYINRLDTLHSKIQKRQDGSHWRKIRSFESGAQAAFAKACELLENSKGDIILSGITTRSPDTLGIESVGPQFLVAALAINLQNRPLLPDTDTDAVQIYHEYTSKLRYQAYRRPRRRVFLDIHRLQEDLEALYNVVASQLVVLDNYKRLLSPASYRVTDSSRQGLYRIESRYVDSQMDRLRYQSEAIHVQRERTRLLKEQVKQTIEILEENHGKAIRVFTIVTVFFLPLSFISSFFGMNTTDIRDTDYDQRFFWIVAIPVTVVVLALAFFYGYKGDAIEERVLALMHDRSERRHQELPKKTVTWGTVTSEPNPVENTFRHRIPPWLKPARKRKQSNSSGPTRRMTDMSYLTTTEGV